MNLLLSMEWRVNDMDFLKKLFHRDGKRESSATTKRMSFCSCCGQAVPSGSSICPYCGVELRTPSGHKIKITGTNAEEVSAVLTQYQKTQEEILRNKASTIEKAPMDSDPYIFISYAHKDSETVIPLLVKLQEAGFRIWFDENIEPASTWDDNIAEHIEKAEFFISMISPSYLSSRNCLDELRYALSQKENIQLLLYLEDVELPRGIAMRTGGVQNIFKKSFASDDAMIQHLSQAKGIDVCIQKESSSLYPDIDDFAGTLLKMATDGNSNAQFELGRCFYDGIHVKQSYSTAVQWYKKAAEQDMAVAQHNLALCYESGIGVEVNPAEAFRWYTAAALQNHATAQNHLGLCYDSGIGTEIDHQKAVYWFKQAAESGHAGAQLNLGLSYKNGEGIEQDIEAAKMWLQCSADQGETRAKRALLSIALTEGDKITVHENGIVDISDLEDMTNENQDDISIEVPKGKFA